MSGTTKGLLYASLFSLLWAIDTVLSKWAYNRGVIPYVWGFQVLFFTAAFTLAYLLVFGKQKPIRKKDIPKMLWLGFIANGIALLFGNIGLKLSTAASYGFIIRTSVIFVIVFSIIYLKERLTWRRITIITIIMFGSYMISTKGESWMPQLGDVFIMLSAVCFAYANVRSKPLLADNDPAYLSLFRAAPGSITLFVMSFIIYRQVLDQEFLFLSILDGLIMFAMLYYLYKTIKVASASYLSIMSMSFPVITSILSYAFLGEIFNIVQVLGAALVLLSLWMEHKS
jgi:drug/metabolite transporter (DMT)-like permease